MSERVFLGFAALVFVPYGILCFLEPAILARIAGVFPGTTTGTIELRAMYGGLQIGLGTLAGLAAFRSDLERPALLALGFVCAGLLGARVLATGLGAELSGYTAGALLFEIALSAFSFRFLSRSAGASEAS